MKASPGAVYAMVADNEKFPELFRGFGPVPGIERIEDEAGVRIVLLKDGSVLEERFQSMEPGRRIVYEATGFGGPLGMWCKSAEAEWQFEYSNGFTMVTWTYEFLVTGAGQRWAVGVLVAPFFEQAMKSCVRRLAKAG